MTLETLQASGFNRSRELADGYTRVGCSQCEALVINGVACHERGCPNRAKRYQEDEDGFDE